MNLFDKLRKKVFVELPVQAAQDGREWFEVDPDDMYPPTLMLIQDHLKAKVKPDHSALASLYEAAKALPAKAWQLAMDKTAQQCSPEERSWRASALEIARLWYTERQHQAINHAPMGLRILKNDRWKL